MECTVQDTLARQSRPESSDQSRGLPTFRTFRSYRVPIPGNFFARGGWRVTGGADFPDWDMESDRRSGFRRVCLTFEHLKVQFRAHFFARGGWAVTGRADSGTAGCVTTYVEIRLWW